VLVASDHKTACAGSQMGFVSLAVDVNMAFDPTRIRVPDRAPWRGLHNVCPCMGLRMYIFGKGPDPHGLTHPAMHPLCDALHVLLFHVH